MLGNVLERAYKRKMRYKKILQLKKQKKEIYQGDPVIGWEKRMEFRNPIAITPVLK